MKKNNYFTYNSNTPSGIAEGDFNIYQARNGGIALIMGDALTFLTLRNLEDLKIDVSELKDFDQTDFRKYYSIHHTFNPPSYGNINPKCENDYDWNYIGEALRIEWGNHITFESSEIKEFLQSDNFSNSKDNDITAAEVNLWLVADRKEISAPNVAVSDTTDAK